MSGSAPVLPTVWIFGDQLNAEVASLRGRSPGSVRVLLVESRAKVESKRWHTQRLHLVLSAMEHFAAELRAAGFEVDYRTAETLTEGMDQHRRAFDVASVVAMERRR